MGIKRLILNSKEVLTGFHLTQMQDNIDIAINKIQNSQFQNGLFITATLIGGIDNPINHGLGHQVQGWTVVDKNAQSDIWQSTSVNNFPEKQIILKSSANVTAKIYFF